MSELPPAGTLIEVELFTGVMRMEAFLARVIAHPLVSQVQMFEVRLLPSEFTRWKVVRYRVDDGSDADDVFLLDPIRAKWWVASLLDRLVHDIS